MHVKKPSHIVSRAENKSMGALIEKYRDWHEWKLLIPFLFGFTEAIGYKFPGLAWRKGGKPDVPTT